jgi:hypothetical protein
LRAIIDSSTDLPTPEPAKMPMRWPWQQVTKVLSARTPRSIGLPTRRRVCAAGGGDLNGYGNGPDGKGPFPSIGRPIASTTRPSQPSLGRTAARTADTTARQPRRTPSSGANGISSAFPPEKPTTSQGMAWPGVSIVTRAPTDMVCSGPATSTIRPRTPTTRPYTSQPSSSSICSSKALMPGARPVTYFYAS